MPDRPWRRATAGSGACGCGTAGRPGPWSAPAAFEMGLLSPEDWGEAAWIGRRLAPPKGWADQVLTVDFTLKGRFFDVLFRARPEGKTYGEAYVLRVGEVDGAPSLMLQVRQYPGGSSPGVKLRRLQVWPLPPTLDPAGRPAPPPDDRGQGTSLRFALDGVLVGALDDATQGEGTFGFLAPEAEAATIHAVDLRAGPARASSAPSRTATTPSPAATSTTRAW
jgi:alpha-L-rhamnosidase